MNCERCDSPLDEGVVLVSSKVHWHDKPTFFLEPRPAFPSATMGRSEYYAFPIPLPAERCRGCGWVFSKASSPCATHDRETGFIFPFATVRWWSGAGAFQPSVWFAVNGKDAAGAECETLLKRGLVLSVVDTRAEASRCKGCGSVAFLSEREEARVQVAAAS